MIDGCINLPMRDNLARLTNNKIARLPSLLLVAPNYINNTMFIKLNKLIHVPKYDIKQHVVSYGNSISYAVVSTPLNDIFSLVPERYRKDFILLVMEISGNIPPHTDSKILSTINIYLKSDNCKTTFYEIVTNTPQTTQIKNQTNGKMFDLNSLKSIGEFVAKNNEAWLLDVSIPHSVTSTESTINRIAVCLQSTKHDVSKVKEMLVETNNI
jgi:hypothetical protein